MTKHGWILFVVIGALGLVMSVATMFDPRVLLGALAETGPAAPGDLPVPVMHYFARWTATALFGVNALSIIIACTAFRRGERWAGLALTYWPLMFLSHLVMYRWGPMSFVQLGWISLSVPALIAHFRRTKVEPAGLTLPTGTGRLA